MKRLFYKLINVSFVFLFLICAVGFIESDFVSAASWTTQVQAPSGADKDGYTVIQNEKQLAYLINNISASGKYRLGRNMNMSGYTWPGIQKTFSGTFDGAGFIIENISSETKATQGLFTSLSGATVRNVSLTNCTFKGYSSVGSIAGSTSGATVIEKIVLTDCKVEVVYSSSGVWPNVGGVVGYADGTTKIQNVFNNNTLGGYVKSSVSNTSVRDIYMGGIVGLTQASVTVKNCLNEVPVTNTGEVQNSNGLFAGGIAGYSYSPISSCGNVGEINGGHSKVSASYVGGIVGYTPNTVTDCYNRGNVTATAKETDISSQSALTEMAKKELISIEYGFLKKRFRMNGSISVSKEGYKKTAYAGGIAGYATKAITRAYSIGTITGGGEYLNTTLKYSFEVIKDSKNFWGNWVEDGSQGSGTESATAKRCLPYSAPICGNVGNTNESNTLYSGTVKSIINNTTMENAWGSDYNGLFNVDDQYKTNFSYQIVYGLRGEWVHTNVKNEDMIYYFGVDKNGNVKGVIGVGPDKKLAAWKGVESVGFDDKKTYTDKITIKDTPFSTTIKSTKSSSIASTKLGDNWALPDRTGEPQISNYTDYMKYLEDYNAWYANWSANLRNGGYPIISAMYW